MPKGEQFDDWRLRWSQDAYRDIRGRWWFHPPPVNIGDVDSRVRARLWNPLHLLRIALHRWWEWRWF